jgi:hypothetical protein
MLWMLFFTCILIVAIVAVYFPVSVIAFPTQPPPPDDGPVPLSIVVLPANPFVPVNYTVRATAIATYADETQEDITTEAVWTSLQPSVATMSGSVIMGVSPGLTTIRAVFRGVTGTATCTASDTTLVAIAITPSNPAVAQDSTLPVTATGTFSDSHTLDITTQVTWGSANHSVATITSAGLVTGVSGGSTTITATSGAVNGTATLFVGS